MKSIVNRQFKLAAFVIFVTLTYSCTEEYFETTETVVEDSKPDSNNPVVKILVSQGWNIDKIDRLSNGDYLVAGDILFSGNIEDYVDTNEAVFTPKQHTSRALINKDLYRNIGVYIHPSVAQEYPLSDYPNEDNWTDAIRNAMTIWNSVPNSGLQFIEVFSDDEADITVTSDLDPYLPEFLGSLDDLVVAAASFPVQSGPYEGRPGRVISINLDYSNNLSMKYDVRFNNMVHEFGHTIGFRHTNWRELKEFNDFYGFYHVPGTPRYGDNPDPHSVMNGGTGDKGFTGLSYYDKVAIAYWYPN